MPARSRKREREKPTLEARLESALGRPQRPVLSVRELARAVGAGRGMAKQIRATLRRMEHAGSIEAVAGGYRMARRDGLVEGRVGERAAAGPGGSVSDELGGSWRIADLAEAGPGDRVLVQPVGDAANREAAIVQVVQAERRSWVGIVEVDRRGARLVPYRDDGPWRVPIVAGHLGGAKPGEVVEARPAPGRAARGQPRAEVVRRFGRPGDPEADFRAVVWRRRLPTSFPPDAEAEAAAARSGLSTSELAQRRDLRDKCFVTIDPETARDHDDAIYVVPAGADEGAARLFVAIADVSHYVVPGSALDRSAWLRGNSVYFPERAIPMLPERLSSDLCSLRPDSDRLVLVAELAVDATGRVTGCKLERAVIRSRAKLAYGEAAAIMQGRAGGAEHSRAVVRQLRGLERITTRMNARRMRGGALDFELPEARFDVDAKGRVCDIQRAQRTIAHRAVEEAMLAANRAVAGALLRADLRCLYRVHERPSGERMEALLRLYQRFGEGPGRGSGRRGKPGGAGQGPSLGPGQIAKVLARVAGSPQAPLVNLVTLRAMKQARYAAENLGHFALAFEAYLHFTSPIRRYADLVVHRAVGRLIDLGDGRGMATGRGRGEPSTGEMQALAIRTSARERIGVAAERERSDLAKCAFMRPHVGECFEATVTGIAPHGLYVTLDRWFVEGLVHVEELDGYFEFDAERYTLVARHGGRAYALGDRLRVRLERVDQLKGWVNFVDTSGWNDEELEASSGSRAKPAKHATRGAGEGTGSLKNRRAGRSKRSARRSGAPIRRRGHRPPRAR